MPETTDPRTVPVPPAAEAPRMRVPSAELDQLRTHAATLQSVRQAVINLTAGRPDTHMMTVGELRAAVIAPPAAGVALPVTWSGHLVGPTGGGPRAQTLLPLVTSYGTPACLSLSDDERARLAGKLAATLHPAETCTTPRCGGSEGELDLYVDDDAPARRGWIAVRVCGTSGPIRWWCSPACAGSAITAAGADIAAADRAFAAAPVQQGETFIDPCRPCGCPKRFGRHADGCAEATLTADAAFAAALPQMMTTAVQVITDSRRVTPGAVRADMDAVFGGPAELPVPTGEAVSQIKADAVRAVADFRGISPAEVLAEVQALADGDAALAQADDEDAAGGAR
ncbi:hypothetical protein P3L51_14865 [Streptomyces sp. PSRA5]|uniref:hypothetical protein n=1 Tax=Streptomyces panacea TaxID=3035064 RepID=UPI00339C6237